MTRKTAEPAEIFNEQPGDDDRLSALSRGEGRAVHPYRDGRDGLIARRRDLAEELQRAERAAERRDRIAGQLRVIDDELRSRRSPLELIAIKTPCRERWEEMQGDDVTRHCGRCHREVHDLSRMTESEIESLLLARAAGSPCVRVRRRPDGRVVTAECPVEPPSLLARGARLLAAGAVFGAAAGVAATLVQPGVLTPLFTSDAIEEREVVQQRAPEIEIRALRSRDEPRDDDGAAGFTMGAADPSFAQVAPITLVAPPRDGLPTPAEARSAGAGVGIPSLAALPITTADLDRHIRWIAPQAWEIDRALVDRALTQAPSATRITPRLIPSEVGDRVIGLKVYGVRRDSLFARLGILNGDTLLDVNGHSFRHAGDILEGYAQLHGASAFFVRVQRRGEERLHVYRITP